ncbi:hypothetical protein QTP86_020792, partial [Hemibagrus guttatus]
VRARSFRYLGKEYGLFNQVCRGGKKMTENGEKENEPDLQRSPGSGTIRPESKVKQRKFLADSTSILAGKHGGPGNSKQGLRCKTCKLAAHLWCSSELSQQVCNGKSGAFKRNFSSPLLTNEQFTVVKEAPPTQEEGKGTVDPVYEALRYGTSLAQMSRSTFNSISESPCQQSEEGQEKLDSESVAEEECGAESEVVSLAESEKSEVDDKLSLQPPRRIELRAIHTYVVLYKFLPQEKNDLELQPGDRVQILDDSNEDWWKIMGVITSNTQTVLVALALSP